MPMHVALPVTSIILLDRQCHNVNCYERLSGNSQWLRQTAFHQIPCCMPDCELKVQVLTGGWKPCQVSDKV